MSTKVRYPFVRKTDPAWVEVPFDAFDREAGTIEVCLQGLPKEKRSQLEIALQSARATHYRIAAQRSAAEAAAGDRIEPSNETDLHRVLSAIQRLKVGDEVKPHVKRELRRQVEDLLRKTRQDKATPEALWVGRLRELCLEGGSLGARVLGVAEALFEGQGALAELLAGEAFRDSQALAMHQLLKARADIIRYGVTGHRGIIGEITLDDGSPLIEDGAPKEVELPWVAEAWVFGGVRRVGTAKETLDLYRELSPSGGLLVSLSEAVIWWQKGVTPTPQLIWAVFAGEATAEVDNTEGAAPLSGGFRQIDPPEEATTSRDGDSPSETRPFGDGE